MSNITKIDHFSDFQVCSSQPGIEDAMNLVRANALESGASLDRMHLKVSQGSLAGRCLLWDQPSLSWVDRTEFTDAQLSRYNEQDDWTGAEDERPETAPVSPICQAMGKHTPGPWVLDEVVGAVYATTKEGAYVRLADTFNTEDEIPEEEDAANLHLIAAAPELLAALKAIRKEYAGISDTWSKAADTAIAKAEGRA